MTIETSSAQAWLGSPTHRHYVPLRISPRFAVAFRRARTPLVVRIVALLAGAVMATASHRVTNTVGTVSLLGVASVAMIVWLLLRIDPGRPYLYTLMGEAGFAVVLVTLGPAAVSPYAVYLCVMPLLAGLRGGIYPTLAVMGAEVAVFAGILVQHHTYADALTATFGPALVMAVGFGVLGSWVRQLRSRSREGASYAAAHRLLSELRAVSQDLRGALDVPSIAQRIAADAATTLGGSRAAILLTSAADGLTLVASGGAPRFGTDITQDPVASMALRTHRPVRQLNPGQGCAQNRVRTAVPLLVGNRCIGVLLVDGSVRHGFEELTALQEALFDDCLQLESGILLAGVRSEAMVAERHRLARDIHDGVAQDISSLGYMVDDLAHQCDEPGSAEAIGNLRTEISRIVAELRRSIYDLHNDVTSDAGLGAVLSAQVQDVAHDSELKVHLALEECDQRLGLDVETELLRIAQEAMANARKHSHAENLWVTCRVSPPAAELIVEDDGIGGAATRKGHFGLRVMRERAARINAELTVDRGIRDGTRVSVVVRSTASSEPSSGGARDLFRLAR